MKLYFYCSHSLGIFISRFAALGAPVAPLVRCSCEMLYLVDTPFVVRPM